MKRVFSILLLIILFPVYVDASEIYSIGDFVYYDPVTTKACNHTNYWTPYNTNSTCYRFVVLTVDDSSSKSTLKIMLDHDIGNSTFANYKTVLEKETSSWNRYSGDIDIIDEDTLYNVMKLESKPTLDNISVNGGVSLGFLMVNTMYTTNKVTNSYYGYWTKNVYEADSSYAYTVTEYANNRLVETNKSRGVRPVLVIDKSLLKKSPVSTNIDSLVKNGQEYKYKQQSQTDSNYKHLQGFTLTKNKLVFHSMHVGDANKGLVFTYSGDNYQTLDKYDYRDTAHGNDMTYNSKTNKVLLLVNGDIHEYNGDTITYEKTYDTNDYSAIGYDDKWNYYYVYSNQRIYLINNNLEKLYSFDHITLSIKQGMEYHNGYLYLSTSESKCPNMYQIYCLEDEWSATTYVYNVKLNEDGTPSKDFGRLVDKLYIGPGIGELESVSFQNNQMFFGYATRKTDSTYLYKFYSIPYEKIMYKPKYTVTYTEDTNKSIITISSNEQLKNIEGFTISSDLKSLTKVIVEDTPSEDVNVCDLYNNCTKATLNEIVIDKSSNLDSSGDDNIIDEEEIIPDDFKEGESNTIIEEILTNPKTGQKFTIILFILFFSLASIIKYFKKVM